MVLRTSVRKVLVAIALGTSIPAGTTALFIPAALAETPAIDVGAAFRLLESEATQAEGLAQLEAAAAAGDMSALSRLAMVRLKSGPSPRA